MSTSEKPQQPQQNQNRKRSKHSQPEPVDYPVVYPRHLWNGLTASAKQLVRNANAAYQANDAVLTASGRGTRAQSRVSLPIIAKMASAMPGSNADGSCPILLRDLAEGTTALASHTNAVRVLLHTNAAKLHELKNFKLVEGSKPEDAVSTTVEHMLVVKNLLEVLSSFPNHLIYESDLSGLPVDDVEDAPMA